MTNLSVIIISYNTKEMTLACIESVYEQTKGISFEIIVVDNNSNDGSAQAIAERFPEVHLIASKNNFGFARANNIAAKHASGEYVLLLNPDTLVLDGALEKLYAFAKNHPDNLIYGGRTLYADYSLNPTSCWKKPSIWSLFCYATGLTSILRQSPIFDPESYGNWKRDNIRNVDIVTGCLLMIQRTFWNRLGGFDNRFFMYGEDADICLRAASEGARPIITPEATIIHYRGASEKVRVDKMIRLFRSKEQLLLSHWPIGKAKLGSVMIRLSVFSRMFATELLSKIKPTKFYDSKLCWHEIWARRQEWIVK